MAAGFVVQSTGYALVANNTAGAGHSPADSTTYYINGATSTAGGLSPNTASGLFRLLVPRAGIIRAVSFAVYTTVAASGESVTVKVFVNGASAATLSTAMTWNAGAGAYNTLNATGLGIAVVQGDYLELEFETPAWVTNPTATWHSVSYYIEV
jgi:hypothetical protein